MQAGGHTAAERAHMQVHTAAGTGSLAAGRHPLHAGMLTALLLPVMILMLSACSCTARFWSSCPCPQLNSMLVSPLVSFTQSTGQLPHVHVHSFTQSTSQTPGFSQSTCQRPPTGFTQSTCQLPTHWFHSVHKSATHPLVSLSPQVSYPKSSCRQRGFTCRWAHSCTGRGTSHAGMHTAVQVLVLHVRSIQLDGGLELRFVRGTFGAKSRPRIQY